MPRPLTLAVLLLFLATPATAADFAVTEETLAAAVREVVPLVEKESGVELGEITVRIATAAEIREVLIPELTAQLAAILGDEEAARNRARLQAGQTAQAILGKYAFEKKAILVHGSAFESVAELVEEPALCTPAGLRAVLVHECVHAADDLGHGFAARLRSVRSTEALEAYTAVIEGHAQVVARRICRASGWTEGFEALTRSIGKTPDRGGEGERQFARTMASAVAFAYHDGETFMRAVEEKGGAKAVARAFREPPATTDLIEHPEWYLDPSLRPKDAFDLDAALRPLVASFDASVWSVQWTSLTKGQLRGAVALLPEDDGAWFVDAVETCRGAVLSPKAAPMSKQVVGFLFVLRTPEDAARVAALIGKLGRIKDERMKEGAIRIRSAKYEALSGDAWSGELAVKIVAAGVLPVRLSHVVGRRDRVVLEVLYSAEPVEREKLESLVGRILGTLLEPESGEPVPETDRK